MNLCKKSRKEEVPWSQGRKIDPYMPEGIYSKNASRDFIYSERAYARGHKSRKYTIQTCQKGRTYSYDVHKVDSKVPTSGICWFN